MYDLENKKVFACFKAGGATPEEVRQNLYAAHTDCLTLWGFGAHAVAPRVMAHNMMYSGDPVKSSAAVAFVQEYLNTSDVLVYSAWEVSPDMLTDIISAVEKGIPILCLDHHGCDPYLAEPDWDSLGLAK